MVPTNLLNMNATTRRPSCPPWALWCIVMLVFFVTSAASAAGQSPIETNPIFRALLAHLMTETPQGRPESEKIDHFIEVLENSLNGSRPPIPVRDLDTYIAFRNRIHESPQEALSAYRRDGLITPLSVTTPSTAVFEQIIDYEADEMMRFLAFVETQLPETKDNGVLRVQLGVWRDLLRVYEVGRQFRDALDTTSADVIQSSRDKGLLGSIVGLGVGLMRGIGQTMVNPLVRQTLFGETAQTEIRRRLIAEIRKLRALSAEEKTRMVRMYEDGVDTALQDRIRVTTTDPSMMEFTSHVPLARAFTNSWLPAYFASIDRATRNRLVWAVFSHPNFNALTEPQQFQVATSALGPVLPYVLHLAAKNPLLTRHPLSRYFCCQTPAPTTPGHLERVRTLIETSLGTGTQSIVHINPIPLAINPLKETYEVILREAGGRGAERTVIAQVLRAGVMSSLQADLRVLKALDQNVDLRRQMEVAGAKDLSQIITAVSETIEAEVDLRTTAQTQHEAARALERKVTTTANGHALIVEIVVPRILTFSSAQTSSTTVLLQEPAKGKRLTEVAEADRARVQAALEAFAYEYLEAAFKGSGFLWMEPSPANVRVHSDPHRIRIELLNFGGATHLDPGAIRSLFASLGRLPLKELVTQFRSVSARGHDGTQSSVSGAPGNPANLEKSTRLLTEILDQNFRLDRSSLRAAQGLLALRELIGEEALHGQLLRLARRNPSILWAPLGAFLKSKLEHLYDRLRSGHRPNILLPSKPAAPATCPLLFGAVRSLRELRR